MRETAFFTVVYPGIEDYFIDFARSICNQSNKEFDLIIFNENNTQIDFKMLFPNIHYKIIPTDPATPIIIRERGFDYLRQQGYTYVIFGDADDWFSSNRVEKSLELLQSYDLVINDVDIVTDSETLIEHYFSHNIQNNTEVLKEMVLHGNFMGLSAAAIRLKALPDVITPEDVVALDWYMFTRMLLSDAKAYFTNEAITYYRQYDHNLIGMKGVTLESLKREISVKLGHYNALKLYGVEYELLATNFNKLMQSVQNEEDLKSLYSKIKQNNINSPFWWGQTKDGLL